MAMTLELSKHEKLKLRMEGWKAGAAGANMRMNVGDYAEGYKSGRTALTNATNMAISDLDMTIADVIDVVLR